MLKKHYIAGLLVVLVVLVLFNLPTQAVAKFKLAISSVFLPLFGLAGSTHAAVDKAGDNVLSRQELIRQNVLLRQENAALKVKLSETEAAWRENAALRQQLGWKQAQRGKLKFARVVARDPANWWRTVQIDLGSRDGVQVNLPVRVAEGLIGKVVAVGLMRSQVLLLGDPNLRVAAKIVETGETGVVFADSSQPLENNMVDISYLSRNTILKPGQLVVTSGDGGVFPAGLPVGTIVDSRPSDNGLSTEARVKLTAPMNALNEVWVVLP